MAVEARHLNLFPSQLLTQRDMINQDQVNPYPYNVQMGSGPPLQTVMHQADALLPFQQPLLCGSIQQQAKTSMKSDSGLTYNLPPATVAPPRKRSRDSLETFTVPHKNTTTTSNNSLPAYPSFLGEEFSLQIHQHQLEIDQIIAHHTKKIRLELEERQKQQARLLISAIGEGIMKKLKEKDDQIQRMGKLNLVLQERVKSLYAENQLWRDLAQTNEAAANSLRSNLEQVLAHVGCGGDEQLSAGCGGVATAVADEAESCCGSCDYGRNKEEEVEVVGPERCNGSTAAVSGGGGGGGGGCGGMCRKCGERESCVLLLPCRHLCVCATCGSQLLNTCPVCNSNMNATVHVNMS